MAGMSDTLARLRERLERIAARDRVVGDDMREAISAAGRDSVSCAIRARRVVEHVVRDVHDRRVGKPCGSQPLEGVLARIVKDGHFPEDLAGFVGAVKGLANRVAHDTNRTYPLEYLAPALDQVLIILEWYFEHERPSGEADATTVETPVASPAPPRTEAAVPVAVPAPVTPAAVEPEPGRKGLVQLAVQGKRFSMSCTVALGLLVATFGVSWMLFRAVEERRLEERMKQMIAEADAEVLRLEERMRIERKLKSAVMRGKLYEELVPDEEG
jgi:hypothetical protein